MLIHYSTPEDESGIDARKDAHSRARIIMGSSRRLWAFSIDTYSAPEDGPNRRSGSLHERELSCARGFPYVHVSRRSVLDDVERSLASTEQQKRSSAIVIFLSMAGGLELLPIRNKKSASISEICDKNEWRKDETKREKIESISTVWLWRRNILRWVYDRPYTTKRE